MYFQNSFLCGNNYHLLCSVKRLAKQNHIFLCPQVCSLILRPAKLVRIKSWCTQVIFLEGMHCNRQPLFRQSYLEFFFEYRSVLVLQHAREIISLQIGWKWITKNEIRILPHQVFSVALKFRWKCSSGLRKYLTLLKGVPTYSKCETPLKYADFQELQNGIFSLLIVPKFEFSKRRKQKTLFESAPS